MNGTRVCPTGDELGRSEDEDLEQREGEEGRVLNIWTRQEGGLVVRGHWRELPIIDRCQLRTCLV
jgi:hypothetical protein